MTMDDIAAAMGVSKSTVSRAISGKGRVGKKTREKILAYIEESGFTPNVVAQGLAQNRTSNVAAVFPDDAGYFDFPFFQKLLAGMSRAAAKNGYDVLVTTVSEGEGISNVKRIAENHKVDGVILCRAVHEDPQAEYLRGKGIPFVSVGAGNEHGDFYVDNDNVGACKDVTAVLLKKNMEKIALLGGSGAHYVTRKRLEGFAEAFHRFGKEVDESLVFLDMDTPEKMDDVLLKIRERGVEGVVCMDDVLAGWLILKCRGSAISIPKDLQVVSCYHTALLDLSEPSITSVSFDEAKLGAAAFSLLLKLIGGERPRNKVLSTYEVVVRESTQLGEE